MEIDPRMDRPGVVVGVDGTWNALGAVAWAAAEAGRRGVPLRVLCAGTDAHAGTPRVQDVLDRACALARDTEPDLPVTTRQTAQDPVDALLDAARTAHLLVLGMADRDRTEELLLGSVALEVSGRASCPVAVVRGEHRTPDDDRPVLVGVDAVADDGAALTVAFDDARRHGGRVIVLHVRQRSGPVRIHSPEQDRAAHLAAWDRLCDELVPWSEKYPDVSVDVEVVRGHPAHAVTAAASGARIVVLGTRGRGAPARALFGSTSREVLRASPVPVIVVGPDAVLRDDAVVRGGAPAAVASIGRASARVEADHPQDRDRLW